MDQLERDDLPSRTPAAVQRSSDCSDAVTERLADTRDLLERLSAELAELRAKVTNLEVALSTSRLIGQAVGIVMAQRKISEDEAFGLLREASQRLRRKVRDIAAEVVLTGEIPSEAA